MKFKHTPEDADALAADLIPSNISADLGNTNWKARLAAVEEMTTWLEGVVEQVDSEVVVRFLAKKGWNEKNFQVSMCRLLGFILQLTTHRSQRKSTGYWLCYLSAANPSDDHPLLCLSLI